MVLAQPGTLESDLLAVHLTGYQPTPGGLGIDRSTGALILPEVGDIQFSPWESSAGFTKRAGIAALACGAIALTLAGCSSNSEARPRPRHRSRSPPRSPPHQAPLRGSDIGKPITVGSATYTVESVKNIGRTSPPEGESQAQGAFIIIKMNVVNTGSSTLTVDPANFTAVAANGQSVQADFNDSLLANGSGTPS